MNKTFPITIPKVVIQDVGSVEKKVKELRATIAGLEKIVRDEKARKQNPVLKDLNRRLKRGETLYYEFLDGEYAMLTQKGRGERFEVNHLGEVVCTRNRDANRYSPVDRVYQLDLTGPSSLVYERSSKGGEI